MSFRTSMKIQAMIFAAMCAYGAYLAVRLPDRVPIHWNINGQVDGYGSKWMNVLIGPGMVLFSLFLTLLIPNILPKNYTIDRFGATYAKVMVLVSAMMAFIAVVIGQASMGGAFNVGQAMMAVMFLFFALLGNVMGKIKRNFFVGIRTPWTIADERVWDATHRTAAKIWFFGGLVGFLLAMIGLPMAVSIVLLIGMSLWPVVDSFLIYKRLGVGS